MTAQAARLLPEHAQLRACTVSRDLGKFADLIIEMETLLGDDWGDLQFRDASTFLAHPMAARLEFLILAIDPADEVDLVPICALLKQAKAQNLATIITAKNIPPSMLHQLMRHGARDFIPYPLPPNAFATVLNRLRNPAPAPQPIERPAMPEAQSWDFKPADDRLGRLLVVQAASGGAGATTFASNLAWEMVLLADNQNKRVCLLDLDFQLGCVASALDLEESAELHELLTQSRPFSTLDLLEAMQCYGEALHVLCAPHPALPVEIITASAMGRLLDMTLANFDYVIVDMPSYICHWTSEVLQRAQSHFLIKTPETKSERSANRLIEAMRAEQMVLNNLRQVLNRDPDFTAPDFKETLSFDHDFSLPFGGQQITEALDHGEPLAEGLGKNPLRLELRRLARNLSQHRASARLH